MVSGDAASGASEPGVILQINIQGKLIWVQLLIIKK